METWLTQLYPVLLSYVGARLSAHDAEDVVQEAILKAIRKWNDRIESSDVRAWLFTIVINEMRTLARKQRRYPRSFPDGCEPAMHDSLRLDRDEELGALRRGIQCLPENHRRALESCDLQGRTGAEAAVSLGVSSGTLSRRRQLATEALRKILRSDRKAQ